MNRHQVLRDVLTIADAPDVARQVVLRELAMVMAHPELFTKPSATSLFYSNHALHAVPHEKPMVRDWHTAGWTA